MKWMQWVNPPKKIPKGDHSMGTFFLGCVTSIAASLIFARLAKKVKIRNSEGEATHFESIFDAGQQHRPWQELYSQMSLWQREVRHLGAHIEAYSPKSYLYFWLKTIKIQPSQNLGKTIVAEIPVD